MRSSSFRKRITTSIGISLAVNNGLTLGQILAWKCMGSVTLFSCCKSEKMIGTTTPYRLGKSNALQSLGKTLSRITLWLQSGLFSSWSSLGRPRRKVTLCTSSFSFSCSRNRIARTLTSMKNSELMKAAMVGRSAGFGLRIFCRTVNRSAGTVPALIKLVLKPRGAALSRGWRSMHMSSYVKRPMANMSDSSPHFAGKAHISGAAYLAGGSKLRFPGASPLLKPKGQSMS
mmetsp:Transcript_31003/g.55524  ORF Transcript_31003/g.55524 Transcript_31003/m.55524 type:complete len:230 (+) Transcript_31003:208-897(+)